jgi:hypothetical protein
MRINRHLTCGISNSRGSDAGRNLRSEALDLALLLKANVVAGMCFDANIDSTATLPDLITAY